MPHDVFVSYSSKNADTASRICAALEAQGVPCWIAPRDILPGASWASSIIDAINASRALLLVFTEESNRSHQVVREVERAVSKRMLVIPFRVHDVVLTPEMEYFISAAHWLDASGGPLDRHLTNIGQQVKALLDGQAAPTRNGGGGGAPVHTGRWLAAGVVAAALTAGVGTSLWKVMHGPQSAAPAPATLNGAAAAAAAGSPAAALAALLPSSAQQSAIAAAVTKFADQFATGWDRAVRDGAEPRMLAAADAHVAGDKLSPALARVWDGRRTELLTSTPPGPDRLDNLYRELADLRSSLGSIDSSFPMTGRLVGRATARKWQQDLAEQLTINRDARLGDAVTHLPARGVGEPSMWQSVSARYARTVDRFDALQERYTQLEDLLDAYARGAGGDDPAGQLARVARAAAATAREGSGAPEGVAFVVAPIEARATALLAVGRAGRESLDRLLADLTSPREVVLAAWRRLDDRQLSNWPVGVADFAVELAAQKRLRATVTGSATAGSATTAAVDPAALVELDATVARRWSAAVSRLLPEEVPEATGYYLREVAPAGILPPERTPDWFRYDLLLADLHAASTSEADVPAAVDRFNAGAARLNRGVTDNPAAASFQKAIGAPFDAAAFAGQGPQGAGWQAMGPHTGQEDKVVFSRPANSITGAPDLMEFRRVVPTGAGARPFYLSTTEMSLGVAMTILNDSKELRGLLDRAKKQTDNRAQIWCIKTAGLVEEHKGWVTTADTITPPAPNSPSDYPLQCIPPEVAIGIARALGCRLPTTDEWRAAVEADRAEWSARYRLKTSLGWKLRDARWTNRGPDGARFRLDAGIYAPPALVHRVDRLSGAVWNEADLPAATAGSPATVDALNRASAGEALYSDQRYMLDDLSVAFRKVVLSGFVPLDGGFHDLVGNVAEYTMDAPLAFAVLPRAPTSIELEDFTRRHKADLHVIGGSAFSPPQVDFRTAYPVDPDAAADGYTDVGFRLAYSDVNEPHVAWLKGALEKAACLTAQDVAQAAAAK